MNETIRKIKQSTLDQLKAGKASIEAKKPAIYAQKYADKKAELNVDFAELDKMLDLTIKQKQAQLNEEIAKARQDVADKKVNYDIVAKAEAEAETEAEVSHAIRAFDEEIAKLEKELG
jgi:hypothetical protein